MLAHILHWMILPFFCWVLSYVLVLLLTPPSFLPSLLAVEQLLSLGCRLPHPGVFAAGELLKWQKIQDLPQVSAVCGTSPRYHGFLPQRKDIQHSLPRVWSSCSYICWAKSSFNVIPGAVEYTRCTQLQATEKVGVLWDLRCRSLHQRGDIIHDGLLKVCFCKSGHKAKQMCVLHHEGSLSSL